MQAKPQQHKPYGLLKQLPIPECPWNSISMDIIETLLTSDSSDSILVIIDRLTKQGIFIPTTIHCTSEDLATLFILHIFSKHGVPECQGNLQTKRRNDSKESGKSIKTK